MSIDHALRKLFQCIDQGATPDQLTRDAMLQTAPDLVREGVLAAGSWEALLARALLDMRRRAFPESADEAGSAAVAPDEPRPDRTESEAGQGPAWFLSAGCGAFRATLERLPTLTALHWQPPLAAPPGHRFGGEAFPTDEDSGVVLFTDHGHAFALDDRLLPWWEEGEESPDPRRRFIGLEPHERFLAAIPRRALRTGRVYFVSAGGQIKASDVDEFRKLSTEATVACLLKEGDRLVTAFAAPADTHVAVWTSLAHGLVFDAGDLRSQGRKAAGVRAVALDDAATVVSAWPTDGRSGWAVLATAQGCAKRMRVADFRPQGRAGAGLQSCRLAPGDTVAHVAHARLEDDLLIVTSAGRWARMPVWDLPAGSRAARGDLLPELGPDEAPVHLRALPPGPLTDI